MTSIVRSTLLAVSLSTLVAPPSFAQAAGRGEARPDRVASAASQSAFVDKVRAATQIFLDVRNTDGIYAPALGCVSGPLEGAMGVHFISGRLLTDATLDAANPEALIYELRNGVARLVGVEYIVLASDWHQTHAPNDPPVLEGQLLQFEDSPNRFGLPPFYQLHVWAWRNNPSGTFVDWNRRVSCDGQ